MKNFNFTSVHNKRKNFIKENENNDHVVIKGTNNVILSAPHGVSQVRLGKFKFREIGSLTTALYLQKNTKSFLIAKTKNNNDDANFDVNCEYRKTMEMLIKENNIKYLIDFHGLSAKRGYDINFGVHLGKNINNNQKSFDRLCKSLEKEKFIISIDKPFMAGSNTIAGAMRNKFENIFTLQIEINCAITNKIENAKKYEKLLNILLKWVESLC